MARARLFHVLPLLLLLFLVAPAAGVECAGRFGGDDVHVGLVQSQYERASVAVADDGTIYTAKSHDFSATTHGLSIARIEEDGTNRESWAIHTTDDPDLHYGQPSLLIVGDRLYMAYARVVGQYASSEIWVAWADMSITPAILHHVRVMEREGSLFSRPHLITDAAAYQEFGLYLVAGEAHTTAGGIWFSRSMDQGLNWERPYDLAPTGAPDPDRIHHSHPRLSFGYPDLLHLVFRRMVDSQGLPRTVLYTRARRDAGGPAEWVTPLQLPPPSRTEHQRADVCASPTTDDVFLAADVHDATGAVGTLLQRSEDRGSSWRFDDPVALGGVVAPSLALKDGLRWYLVAQSGSSQERYAFTANPGKPATWTGPLCLSESSYGADWFRIPASLAISPTHSNGLVAVWRLDSTGGYPLVLDAEWFADPGYPNTEPWSPTTLAGTALTPPALVDLDGEPGLEVVLGSTVGIEVHDGRGAPLPGWPVPLPGGEHPSSIAVGDLNGDGRPVVVAGSVEGRVHVFRVEGAPVLDWSVHLGTASPVRVAIGPMAPPQVRQIVAANGTALSALDWRGRSVGAGWPVDMGEPTEGPLALGDVDEDGWLEVVVRTASRLKVWSAASSSPELSLWYPGRRLGPGPVLGDLDLDGDLEILFGTDEPAVEALHHDGTPVAGWPFTGLDAPVAALALANVVGLHEPEVVAPEESLRVHLLDHEGIEANYFPASLPGSHVSVGEVVVESVSRPSGDLVLGLSALPEGWVDQGLAYSNFAVVPPAWPESLPTGRLMAPAMGDVDADGRNEVVWLSEGHLFWTDVGHPPNEHSERTWPQPRHDAAGSSCWECPEPVAVSAPSVQPSRVRFAAPLPSPASSTTRLQWELPAAAVVELSVHDARGRRVRTLHRAPDAAGPRELTFDLSDQRGEPLASGVYYFRLRVAGPTLRQELVRKLVCIR